MSGIECLNIENGTHTHIVSGKRQTFLSPHAWDGRECLARFGATKLRIETTLMDNKWLTHKNHYAQFLLCPFCHSRSHNVSSFFSSLSLSLYIHHMQFFSLLSYFILNLVAQIISIFIWLVSFQCFVYWTCFVHLNWWRRTSYHFTNCPLKFTNFSTVYVQAKFSNVFWLIKLLWVFMSHHTENWIILILECAHMNVYRFNSLVINKLFCLPTHFL